MTRSRARRWLSITQWSSSGPQPRRSSMTNSRAPVVVDRGALWPDRSLIGPWLRWSSASALESTFSDNEEASRTKIAICSWYFKQSRPIKTIFIFHRWEQRRPGWMKEMNLESEDCRPAMKMEEGLVVAQDFARWWCLGSSARVRSFEGSTFNLAWTKRRRRWRTARRLKWDLSVVRAITCGGCWWQEPSRRYSIRLNSKNSIQLEYANT